MKVLFVDDERWRFDSMLEWGIIPNDAVWAKSALEAIDCIVDLGPFDTIFLDHDLATFVQSPYPREITGNDVAGVLCCQEWKPETVVVHSTNPAGALRIAATLNDGAIPHVIKPITGFADDHRKKGGDL